MRFVQDGHKNEPGSSGHCSLLWAGVSSRFRRSVAPIAEHRPCQNSHRAGVAEHWEGTGQSTDENLGFCVLLLVGV